MPTSTSKKKKNKLIKIAQLSFISTAILLSACSFHFSEPRINIAVSPWPAFELLHLAKKKKFFEEVGLDFNIVRTASLAESERAYHFGRVNGLASTLVEVVQAALSSKRPLQLVMIPDFSNGADVVIANKKFSNLHSLEQKTIGIEVSSLGLFFLSRALEKINLTLEDIHVRAINPDEAKNALAKGIIDAYVTYPPFSSSILKNKDLHVLFSSRELPYDIIDVVAIEENLIDENPYLVHQLHKVWDKALQYTKSYPQQAYQIMSDRENITAAEFIESLKGIKILYATEQKQYLESSARLQENIKIICKILVESNTITDHCHELKKYVKVSIPVL